MSVLTKEDLIKINLPTDLQLLIENFDCCEELLEEMECRFFEADEVHNLISHSYLSEEDKQSKEIMANVSAIDEVFKFITFVMEAIDGNIVGYWHGPESTDITKSPIIMYTTDGQFRILSGSNIVESLVGDYIFDEDDEFLEFQDQFKECGIDIVSKWDDLVEIKPKTDPSKLHEEFYSANLKN